MFCGSTVDEAPQASRGATAQYGRRPYVVCMNALRQWHPPALPTEAPAAARRRRYPEAEMPLSLLLDRQACLSHAAAAAAAAPAAAHTRHRSHHAAMPSHRRPTAHACQHHTDAMHTRSRARRNAAACSGRLQPNNQHENQMRGAHTRTARARAHHQQPQQQGRMPAPQRHETTNKQTILIARAVCRRGAAAAPARALRSLSTPHPCELPCEHPTRSSSHACACAGAAAAGAAARSMRAATASTTAAAAAAAATRAAARSVCSKLQAQRAAPGSSHTGAAAAPHAPLQRHACRGPLSRPQTAGAA